MQSFFLFFLLFLLSLSALQNRWERSEKQQMKSDQQTVFGWNGILGCYIIFFYICFVEIAFNVFSIFLMFLLSLCIDFWDQTEHFALWYLVMVLQDSICSCWQFKKPVLTYSHFLFSTSVLYCANMLFINCLIIY